MCIRDSDDWEPDQTRVLEYREIFQHEQMVNRPQGIVDKVYLLGELAWDGEAGATDALGKKKLGSYLLSGDSVIDSLAKDAA